MLFRLLTGLGHQEDVRGFKFRMRRKSQDLKAYGDLSVENDICRKYLKKIVCLSADTLLALRLSGGSGDE